MTTPSATPPRTAPETRSGRTLGARFLVAFLLGLVLVVVLGVGALYAYGQQYAGRILPGVHVGAVDVSGMDSAAARSALADAYGSLSDGRIVVQGPAGQTTISYAQIDRGPDIDTMVSLALAAGRHGEPVAGGLAAGQGPRIAPEIGHVFRDGRCVRFSRI